MKAWLGAPITRGEAIAWAVFIPALGVIAYTCVLFVRGVSVLPDMSRQFKAPLPPELQLYANINPVWWVVAFAACALVPLAALVTKQRAWVRIAAPIVFGLIAYAFVDHYGVTAMAWLKQAAAR